MKIPADQIAIKGIAGETKDGRKVVYIATHGGLHAFFCKNSNGDVEAIGAAAHKAIARFLASKKEDISWEKDFDGANEKIEKSHREYFNNLRKAIFFNGTLDSPKTDVYLVYNIMNQVIQAMHKSELEDAIKSGDISGWDMIRDTSLSESVKFIRDTDLYKMKGNT